MLKINDKLYFSEPKTFNSVREKAGTHTVCFCLQVLLTIKINHWGNLILKKQV